MEIKPDLDEAPQRCRKETVSSQRTTCLLEQGWPQRRRQVPPGLRDHLPDELRRRRLVERSIMETFRLWGYEEVSTPTFEYYDVLTSGAGDELKGLAYKFVDPHGDILALRPEMTTPIARLVATRLQRSSYPGRYSYLANVFRHADPSAGDFGEFWQAGVEIIGSGSVLADAESIALCVHALSGTGLSRFQLDIGHVGFVNGIMADAGLGESEMALLRDALLQQDFVRYRRTIAALPIPSQQMERLASLESLRGGGEVLESGAEIAGQSRSALAALSDLRMVLSHLEWYDVKEHVSIDLGLVKDFDYYTGVVFQGYATGTGYAICSGGRYDGLVRRFGPDLPSTGFAVGVERVVEALRRAGATIPMEPSRKVFILTFTPDCEAVAVRDASRLRTHGCVVRIDLSSASPADLVDGAQQGGYDGILVYRQAEGGEVSVSVISPTDRQGSDPTLSVWLSNTLGRAVRSSIARSASTGHR